MLHYSNNRQQNSLLLESIGMSAGGWQENCVPEQRNTKDKQRVKLVSTSLITEKKTTAGWESENRTEQQSDCVLKIQGYIQYLHSAYTIHQLYTKAAVFAVSGTSATVSTHGSLFSPSRDSQSCWEDGRAGRSRALYSNTTEEEMTSPPIATCSITSPVSWAGNRYKKSVGQSVGVCLH